MMKSGKLFLLCFVLITSALNSSAQTADKGRIAADREIHKLMADNHVPVLGLGVVRDGKLLPLLAD